MQNLTIQIIIWYGIEIFYLTKITEVEIDDTINKYSTININNTNLRKRGVIILRP